jgi:hypothetical protein
VSAGTGGVWRPTWSGGEETLDARVVDHFLADRLHVGARE